MKRVCLVSLPGLVQEATRAALMSLEDVTLVGIISGALSATALLPQLQPDLLVVDANLPEEEVEALLRWTKEHTPGLPCVVMTMTSQQRDLALSWGADAAIQRGRLFGQLETTLSQLPPIRVPDGPSSPDSSWQPASFASAKAS